MANMSVRKLDDKVYKQLRVRAALHGVSTEEEARRILSQAVSSPESLSDLFKKQFGLKHGIDLQLAKSVPHEPMDIRK